MIMSWNFPKWRFARNEKNTITEFLNIGLFYKQTPYLSELLNLIEQL